MNIRTLQAQVRSEIFSKLKQVQGLIDQLKVEVSTQLLLKEKALGVPLTQDLRQKCHLALLKPQERSTFECKICFKKFDDGRKLGGHVSRAHKGQMHKQEAKQEAKQDAKQDGKQEGSPESKLKKEPEIKCQMNQHEQGQVKQEQH